MRENAARISPPLFAAGITALLALLLVAGWFLLVAPKRTQAADLAGQIEATQVLLEAPRPEPGSAADPETANARLTRAMPDRVDTPAVVLELHGIAGEADVRLDAITPQPPLPLATYQTQPIQVTLQGTFFGFVDFVRRLRSQATVVAGTVEGDGRLYSIDNLSFAEGEGGFPRLTGTLTVSTFFGPTAPPEPGAEPSDPDPSTSAAPELNSP